MEGHYPGQRQHDATSLDAVEVVPSSAEANTPGRKRHVFRVPRECSKYENDNASSNCLHSFAMVLSKLDHEVLAKELQSQLSKLQESTANHQSDTSGSVSYATHENSTLETTVGKVTAHPTMDRVLISETSMRKAFKISRKLSRNVESWLKQHSLKTSTLGNIPNTVRSHNNGGLFDEQFREQVGEMLDEALQDFAQRIGRRRKVEEIRRTLKGEMAKTSSRMLDIIKARVMAVIDKALAEEEVAGWREELERSLESEEAAESALLRSEAMRLREQIAAQKRKLIEEVDSEKKRRRALEEEFDAAARALEDERRRRKRLEEDLARLRPTMEDERTRRQRAEEDLRKLLQQLEQANKKNSKNEKKIEKLMDMLETERANARREHEEDAAAIAAEQRRLREEVEREKEMRVAAEREAGELLERQKQLLLELSRERQMRTEAEKDAREASQGQEHIAAELDRQRSVWESERIQLMAQIQTTQNAAEHLQKQLCEIRQLKDQLDNAVAVERDARLQAESAKADVEKRIASRVAALEERNKKLEGDIAIWQQRLHDQQKLMAQVEHEVEMQRTEMLKELETWQQKHREAVMLQKRAADEYKIAARFAQEELSEQTARAERLEKELAAARSALASLSEEGR